MGGFKSDWRGVVRPAVAASRHVEKTGASHRSSLVGASLSNDTVGPGPTLVSLLLCIIYLFPRDPRKIK